jgi:hypothetical protein
MKPNERLSTGQIVSWNFKWWIAYRSAGNCFLMQFNDYMEIYNTAMTAADVLSDDALLNSAIGVIGELAPEMEDVVGGFADRITIISTNQHIQEQRP